MGNRPSVTGHFFTRSNGANILFLYYKNIDLETGGRIGGKVSILRPTKRRGMNRARGYSISSSRSVGVSSWSMRSMATSFNCSSAKALKLIRGRTTAPKPAEASVAVIAARK